MVTEDELNRLDALYQKTTPGDWYTHDGTNLMALSHGTLLTFKDWNEDLEDGEDPLPCERRFEPLFEDSLDALWIAQAHRMWPHLVNELRGLWQDAATQKGDRK